MAEPTLREIQAELATLRAEVRGQRRARARRRAWPLAIVIGLVTLLPLSVVAAGPTFSDLESAGEAHRGNIRALGDAGITTGFPDPNNAEARLYDPKGLVTREEMASFLARTAGLGGNPAVANAATVGGFPANTLSRISAAATIGPFPLTTTPQILTTVPLAAPAPGYAYVTGAAVFYASGQTNAMASARVRMVNGGASHPLYAVIGTIPATALEQSLAPTWVFRVPQAGPQSFVIEALIDPASTGAVTVANIALNVLYVPFASDGASGASAPETPATGWPPHPPR
ncbi:MAG TPA: hypothetical protein VIL85_20560 [Thermomicrobiales bacterium]|jgi:hypothetical protein